MSTPSLRILALEPDPACGRRLRHLIAQRTGAHVTLVPTVDAAIASMSERIPDVILTSTLLPPQEEMRLQAHLKELDRRSTLPVLMVPPVLEPIEAAGPRRGMFPFARRSKSSPVTFDVAAIAARIEDAIAESRRQAADRLARMVEDAMDADAARAEISVRRADAADNVRRFRAPRCVPTELPWLSGARTSYGLPIRILNISGSGMLLEASDKIVSGSATDIQLYGPDTTIVVPARVVRAEVAGVNNRGVKYQMAAAFERKLDLERVHPVRPPSSPRALADLLARVSDEIEAGRDALAIRAAFEQGLQQLIPAREIRLRDNPEPSDTEGDSVYFRVPTSGVSRAVLQVTFEPDYEPESRELTLLKASATAAAIVLLYEERRPPAPVRIDYLATAALGSGIGGG